MNFDFKKSKNTYEMDKNIASEMLNNVFAACDKEPNTIPFDKLVLRGKIRTTSFNLPIVLAAIMLTIQLCLPPVLYYTTISHAAIMDSIQVVEHHVEDGQFFITLYGTDIIFEQIYYLDNTGIEKAPFYTDSFSGQIIVPYPDTEITIFIPEQNGRMTQILLMPKEGS